MAPLSFFTVIYLAILATISQVIASQHISRHPRSLPNRNSNITKRCKARPPQPPSTTSHTTAVATSPASNSDNPPPQGKRGKVGLAWANGDNPDIANFVTDAVG